MLSVPLCSLPAKFRADRFGCCFVHFCRPDIGIIKQEQDRWEEAAEFFLEDLRISRENLGDSHPNVAVSLYNIALLEHDMGRTDSALKRCQQAHNICLETLGTDHVHTVTIGETLASLKKMRKRKGWNLLKNLRKRRHSAKKSKESAPPPTGSSQQPAPQVPPSPHSDTGNWHHPLRFRKDIHSRRVQIIRSG